MIGVEHYDEKRQRAAQRVLDTLDRLDEREGKIYDRDRQRRQFRSLITVSVADPDNPILKPGPENSFRAWGRSISETGLAFIHVEPIKHDAMLIRLDLGEKPIWFRAQAVRSREFAEEGFFEFGVRFFDRW